jgi:putative FmdB family regulatory protein
VPTYQYACTACDERLEAVQGFTDAPLTECPVCGGALRKVFSAVGVVFKGSGFYKNDSRDSAKKPAPKKNEPAAASATGSSSSDSSSASSSSSSSSSSSGDSRSAAPASAPAATPASKSA